MKINALTCALRDVSYTYRFKRYRLRLSNRLCSDHYLHFNITTFKLFLTTNAASADDSFDALFNMPEVKTENHTVATVPLQVPVLMMSLQN